MDDFGVFEIEIGVQPKCTKVYSAQGSGVSFHALVSEEQSKILQYSMYCERRREKKGERREKISPRLLLVTYARRA